MFSLISDKAFSIKASELHKKFYLQKEIMTFSETKSYIENFKDYESYFEVLDHVNDTTFDGITYTFKNNKHFKRIPIRVHVSGIGLTNHEFIENYEGKMVKLDKIRSLKAVQYRKDDDIGAIVFIVDDIYNEHDWQNHLALLRLENDWLQPDEF